MTALALALLAPVALAGGGPAGVLVVYNADDPQSIELAEKYQAARSVPRGQLCGLSGVDPLGDALPWDEAELLVVQPVAACLAALPQPEEIDALVLIKGLPYRVDLSAYSVSLDAALQVLGAGRSVGGAPLLGQPQASSSGLTYASVENPEVATTLGYTVDFTLSNPYMGWYLSASGLTRLDTWPEPHRRAEAGRAGDWDFEGGLFVVGRLDGFTYEDAGALIDRALAAEEATPEGEWLCMAAADSARGARDPECELAARRLAEAGHDASFLTPHDPALSGRRVVAYFTGAAGLTGAIDGLDYAPGAVVDNLTSYGAVPQNFRCSEDGETCPASESQTSIARFVRAGATGVHGAVAEPLNNTFPNAAALLLYSAGYSLGESWLLSTWHLYWQNIYLGDPLTTPWRARPQVQLQPSGELTEGRPVELSATHPDGVASVRLYVDGVLAASGDGDSLQVDLGLLAGEQVELLAIAVAEDAPLSAPDWPAPEVLPRPGVQGWTAATFTVAEAPVGDSGVDSGDDGGADSGGLSDPKGGCGGCGGAGRGGGAGLLLLALLTRARRAKRPSLG